MTSDFRAGAARATLAKLGNGSAKSLAGLNESGCIFIPGGRALHYALDLPSLAVVLACAFSLIAMVLLVVRGALSRREALAATLLVLVVVVTLRKAKSVILRFILSLRRDGLLRTFPDLPVLAVAIEEARTVRKVKLVSEDEGVCMLDAERQRLLLEGCSFRHVIYARDVSFLEPLSGYALSAVRLVCRLGGDQIDMVITTAGQGPLASLVHAFAPRRQAAGLGWILSETLFGDSGGPRRNELPPVLPRS